ncbi:tetratricopeptide repeat protein [Hankyongella ginsenosidimutans]|uniref:Tetratricopeptide repeat protein n=1 Tax=Hankyongella ginsenosidimutans TaxID=1763828 RepID=A0A4D7CBI9_9SPHN|nr:tetratricopeptide repeat protein [Hankyongella ginsenosidimutans]QCI79686.1 tetratricopeptide repeat protein [Hankyongella ginsenosidimutans]
MAQSGLKNPDAANRELSAAEAADPGNVRVKLEQARLEAGAKNIPAAVSAVDAALKLQPTNVRALMLKGDLSRGTEGLAKALGYFNQALQIDPGNFEALIERAATYVDLRREQEARADLKKVFAVVPDHPLGLYLEAVMRARTGDYAGAQGLMTRTKGALDKYPPAMLLQGRSPMRPTTWSRRRSTSATPWRPRRTRRSRGACMARRSCARAMRMGRSPP